MNELRGLTQNEVEERMEQGQVNYTGRDFDSYRASDLKKR